MLELTTMGIKTATDKSYTASHHPPPPPSPTLNSIHLPSSSAPPTSQPQSPTPLGPPHPPSPLSFFLNGSPFSSSKDAHPASSPEPAPNTLSRALGSVSTAAQRVVEPRRSTGLCCGDYPMESREWEMPYEAGALADALVAEGNGER
jgi:hypothetical protein